MRLQEEQAALNAKYGEPQIKLSDYVIVEVHLAPVPMLENQMEALKHWVDKLKADLATACSIPIAPADEFMFKQLTPAEIKADFKRGIAALFQIPGQCR